MFTKKCNSANFGGKRARTDFIVIHYTGNLGDSARNNAAYFAREAVKASAHYFVDEAEIWNSVPPDYIAWHCGAKSYRHPECRNANSIGVEICMLDKNGVPRAGSIANAVSLTRDLMKQYGVPANHVLRHFDVTGKDCPAPMVVKPALWQQFVEDISNTEETEMSYEKFVEFMERYAGERGQAAAHDWARAAIERAKADGISDGMRPQAFVTREEVLTMIDRAREK